jgi:hypothetical protein
MSPARTHLVLGVVGAITALLLTSLSSHIQHVFAATNHVVISQIQLGATGKANAEFVELYNPTIDVVDISGWRLSKRSASISGTLTTLVSSMSGTIAPHGYFLITHPDYTNATVAADLLYSNSSGIAVNNSVLLYSDAGKTIVDKVGFGTAQDVETTAYPSLSTDQSIIRKASNTSDAVSLVPGGTEECAGNGLDTDYNSADFILLSSPIPRNTNTSPCPPFPTVTPITEPSATPTNTPESTSTPTPTQTPTPTIAPTPTTEATPTPLTSVSPYPTPTQDEEQEEHHGWKDIRIPISKHKVLLCKMEYKTVRYGRRTVRIPQIVCHIITEEYKNHDKKNHFAN